jgi:hypothetical protein
VSAAPSRGTGSPNDERCDVADPKTPESETGATGGAHEEDTVASGGYPERQPVDAAATERFVDEADRLETHNTAAGDSEGLRGQAQHDHGRYPRGSDAKPTGEPGPTSGRDG